MPRSGTTWLARLLATAPRTALAGREPMNPHRGQYALGGTLCGWAELTAPTSKQRTALRTAYRGRNPYVFSRYGRRQWAAPLPWTRLIVKDPFAMLSVPAIVEVTGAVVVLLYRHPGAILASYRRMGWSPDLDELAPVLAQHRRRLGVPGAALPRPGEVDEPEAIARFWSALYEMALAGTAGTDATFIVSHEELASGGPDAARRLLAMLGLGWSARTGDEWSGTGAGASPAGAASTSLHNFNRAPSEVAGEWRRRLSPDEIRTVEAGTAQMRDRLRAARVVLHDDRPATA